MPYYTQCYTSRDTNAPALTGQVGSLITVFNKCLVDGYTTASVTSIVESGTNYTVTLAVANSTLRIGQYILFAGGSPAGVNIAMKINSVTSTTVVVCTGPGSLGSITGTITYARAPLQWERPFSAGTNSQTYRGADTSGNRLYLQVVDNASSAGGALEAIWYGAEVMSADQTITTNKFPTVAQAANGMCVRKSATANSTVREWALVGNGKSFYFFSFTGDTADRSFAPMFFGDPLPFKPADGFGTLCAGTKVFNSSSVGNGLVRIGAQNVAHNSTNNPVYWARSHTQVGTSVLGALVGQGQSYHQTMGSTYCSWLNFPNPIDAGIHAQPVFVSDLVSTVRGRMPGLYSPLHASSLTNMDIITGVSGLPGGQFIALGIASNDAGYGTTYGQLYLDLSETWE